MATPILARAGAAALIPLGRCRPARPSTAMGTVLLLQRRCDVSLHGVVGGRDLGRRVVVAVRYATVGEPRSLFASGRAATTRRSAPPGGLTRRPRRGPRSRA